MPKRKAKVQNSAQISGAEQWNRFTWKSVEEEAEHFEGEDAGGYDDSMFFGLEELDGNSYKIKKNKHGSMQVTMTTSANKKKEKSASKEKASNKAAKSDEKKTEQKEDTVSSKLSDLEKYTNVPAPSYAKWANIELHTELTTSLEGLGFETPTPIQSAAIPPINMGESDVVGAAETGSGKTLAFTLPIINSLLKDWVEITTARIKHGVICPYALIIVPTRELAMQIASVIKEVTLAFKKTYRMEVVSVVGGMSEQKQRRQLEGKSAVHFLVATPGRLCELFEDETLPVFKDMSQLRYLVVDEADRIVEEGHFSELHRVFSRISDHEKLAAEGGGVKEKGNSVFSTAANKKEGKQNYNMDIDEDLVGQAEIDAAVKRLKKRSALKLDDEVPLELMPKMPSEEELERARASQTKVPYYEIDPSDEEEDDEDEDEDKKEEEDAGSEEEEEEEEIPSYQNKRQTLLFSATALRIKGLKEQHGEGKKGGMKKKKKTKPLPGLSADLSAQLPDHVHQLMSLVGSRPRVDLVDVTSADALSTVKGKESKQENDKEKGKGKKKTAGDKEKEEDEGINANVATLARNLPKHLAHKQVSTPTEEKDVYAYYYLHSNPGQRVLIFVNSIKTARRLDGLLRALNLNCRVIHAQLQQRQRIRALESFQKSTSGILVATDVAARGLDIANIDTVLHYDVARSPQVYIHRSGRTARANRAGTSISMVSPEDHVHHSAIVSVVGKAAAVASGEGGKMTKTDKIKAKLGGLEDYPVDTAALGVLRSRCNLAKRIFLQSFLQGQEQKDSTWLKQTSSAADIEVDDELAAELYEANNGGAKGMAKGISKEGKGAGHGKKMSKKELERMRWELRQLLATPVASSTSGISSRKKGFFVVGTTSV